MLLPTQYRPPVIIYLEFLTLVQQLTCRTARNPNLYTQALSPVPPTACTGMVFKAFRRRHAVNFRVSSGNL
ncbi:hypothetical protein SUGI_0227180 [Cryptomeria japonica]|nr:hypothetical protein SUGI_0227180 [Cryptomeria japonica]